AVSQRSAGGHDLPLLVGAAAGAVLGQVGAVGGTSHAVQEQAGAPVLDQDVVGVGDDGPLLVGAVGVAFLADRRAVRGAAHPVQEQAGGQVLDPDVVAVVLDVPL